MIFNKIKELIEWIKYSHTIVVDGKRCVIDKRIRNINVRGEEINIGEEIIIHKKQWKWVKIVNTSPIKYSHKTRSDEFTEEYLNELFDECMLLNSRTICAGDSCIIAIYGKIKVLGFMNNSNEGVKILVSYASIGYHYETVCPDGAEFLIEPEKFIKLRKISQNNSRPLNFWRE